MADAAKSAGAVLRQEDKIMFRQRTAVVLTLALALALAATACGSDSGGTSPSPTATASSEASDASPSRIISLSPSATEMLFAIGAGDLVIAVDDQSNYPESAPKTDLSGYTPNLEAIADYEPDLVIAASDPGGLADGLGALDIELVLLDAPADLDGALGQLQQVGELTGHEDEADALVAQLQAEVDALVADLPTFDEPVTYYHELDPALYSITSDTFIGAVYGLFGLVNIADEAGLDSPYPQLSEEFILESDPDVIFLACVVYCQQDAETVAARPGWGTMTAVTSGSVIELNEDVASRWGPRIVDLIEDVAAALTALAA